MTKRTDIPPQPVARPASAPVETGGGGVAQVSATVGADGPPAGKSTDPASPDYINPGPASSAPELTAGAGGDGSTGEQSVGNVGATGSGMASPALPEGISPAQRRKLQDQPVHTWPEEMQREAGVLWTDTMTPRGRVITYSVFGSGGSGTTTREMVLTPDKATDEDADAARTRLAATV